MRTLHHRAWLALPFALFVVFAVIDVPRGVDGVIRNAWRECDFAAVARNFHLEGLNIFFPRIDWRGMGPGFVESEFPLFPWLTALTYRVFGVHEMSGRVLIFLASIGTLSAFGRLASRLLPPVGSAVAVTFFALSPLFVRCATSLQPEAPMFLFYVLACLAFIEWLESDKHRHLALAMAAASLAILCKLTASNIGLLFGFLLLRRDGLAALRAPRYWVAAAACITPPVLWYAHARSLWTRYGNSLGLSNKDHWLDLASLGEPSLFFEQAATEVFFVWMPTGVLLGMLALLSKKRGKVVEICLTWLVSLAIFYVVTIRTTAEDWAVYYHLFTIAPASLLIGSAVSPLAGWIREAGVRASAWTTAPLAFIPVTAAILLTPHLARAQGRLIRGLVMLAVAMLSIAVVSVAVWNRRDRAPRRHASEPAARRRLALVSAAVLTTLLATTFAFETSHVLLQMRPDRHVERFACISTFSRHIPEGEFILASGGRCLDRYGQRLAYNTPYAFYWLDRKGRNVCSEQQSIEFIEEFAMAGYAYFVADPGRMSSAEGFEYAMREEYDVLAECDEAVLFALRPRVAGQAADPAERGVRESRP